MQAVNDKEYDELVLRIHKEVKEIQTSTGWESFIQGKVNGYKKKSETNSVILMATTTVNLPLQKVVEFFMKEDSLQKMNDTVLQNKVVYEKKDQYKICHLQMKIPFPLDNREIISLATWINEGNKVYLGEKSCNFPIQPNPKFVMAQMNIGAWIFEKIDANTTKITNISDMNPMGNIPDFLKSFATSKKIQELSNIQPVLKKQIKS